MAELGRHRKTALSEDWATLRAAYLPLNQAMRRTVEFLEQGFRHVRRAAGGGARAPRGSMMNLTALTKSALPWVPFRSDPQHPGARYRLKASRNDDPMALLRYSSR